ncbi:MAG TPA: hypothetical protein VFR02_02095, partial [bacterium]|nr:hypothetical protein [bacterium]
PVKKGLDERLPNGVPRWRYRVANLTLWKYESRDKGILEAAAPQDAGDFRVLTPEGVSFGSDSGEVRDACENAYFKYDGVGENGKYRILKYTHGEGLAFADKLEFWMDRDGKMQKIRFGTLDEH